MHNDAVDSFEVFPWNENFETGIQLIDEQHKQLVCLLNKLAVHLTCQSNTIELNQVFDELAAYADLHFRTEEKIWQPHFKEDSWFVEHRHAHSSFISKVLELKAEEDSRPLDEVIKDILKFLTHWLASHILNSDMRMAKTLHAIESGLSLKKAKKYADRKMSRSTNVLIETVLSMYDNLSSCTLDLLIEKTERKRIGDALHASEKREKSFSDAVTNSVPGLLYLYDDKLRLIRWNKKHIELTGYASEELANKYVLDFFEEQHHQKILDKIKSTYEDGYAEVEVALLTKDGSLIPFLFTAVPLVIDGKNYFSGVGIDITDRKLAEKALRENEARFHALSDATFEGIAFTEQGVVVDANQQLADMLGYDMNELQGMHSSNCIAPEDRELAFGRMLSGNEEPYELRLLCKDGTLIFTEVRPRMISIKGRPMRVTAVRDITERKQAEKSLNRANRALRTLSQCNEVLVCAKDEAQFLHDICQAIVEEGGYRLAWIGFAEHDKAKTVRPMAEVGYDEDYLDTVDISWADTRRGRGPTGIAIRTRKPSISQNIQNDPKFAPWREAAIQHDYRSSIALPLIDNDQVLGALNIYAVDPDAFDKEEVKLLVDLADNLVYGITSLRTQIQHQQADQLVRKLSQAINDAGEAILITDRKGIIEYTNPSCEKITGYTVEEVIGQSPGMFNSGNQDAAFYKDMWNTITSGKAWRGKVINRKKDGSLYPVMLTISPIHDESGDVTRFTHFVGIQSDLTKIENLEHQFYQAQKMDAIGTLVSGVSHDFNNMLSGIMGNVYFAKKKSQGRPDVIEKLDDIETLAFHAAEMIKQLLTFARKGSIEMQRVSLTSFLKQAFKFAQSAISKEIRCSCNICQDELFINGDITQIQQVLMNLMNNARDALSKTAQAEIICSLSPYVADDLFLQKFPELEGTRFAHLSVRDNGSGIPAEKLDKVFEPFFTTKKAGEGTGLGLAMVYGAIQSHKGAIEVESECAKGTTFHIYLPLIN